MKGFGPDLLWSGLWSGLPAIALAQARRAGCRAPPALRIMIGLHFSSQQPGIDEVNFWQPGGTGWFRALGPQEPFLFKLHAPHHKKMKDSNSMPVLKVGT